MWVLIYDKNVGEENQPKTALTALIFIFNWKCYDKTEVDTPKGWHFQNWIENITWPWLYDAAWTTLRICD